MGLLTGGAEKREGERATRRIGGGVEIYGRPGDVEERPWVEEAARSGSDEL